MGGVAPWVMLDAVKREREYRAAEGSLAEFLRRAWHVIEPSTEYSDNWHVHAICEHLEAVSAGEITNLLINVPPGTSKSIIVSAMWPAWEWLADQSLRVLGASYGEDLAVRDATKTRAIISSPWYQARWPQVQIARGQDQKTHYALTGSGWRIATSVGGRATGQHPDRKIVDDPHSARQAQSDAERTSATEWFKSTLSTRGVSRGAKTVVVMQRLHEQDVSGLILEELASEYDHLFLPMRYESGTRKKATSIGFEDPRTVEGSLLWPQLFPEPVVAKLEVALGSYGAAGQLQQRPAPAGGGILKVAHIQLWPADKALPDFDAVIQSWDTAFTEKTTGDPSACTVWGFFQHEGKRCMLLLDASADTLSYPKLKKKVIEDWSNEYGEQKRRADFVLVEQKASGQSIIQDLRVAGIPVRPYNPGKADKVTRAHMAAPILETDVVYVMESKAEPGKPVTWARPLIKQAEDFPNAAHDDLTDTFTQVTVYARDAGLIASPAVEEEDTDDEIDDEAKPGNPYSR